MFRGRGKPLPCGCRPDGRFLDVSTTLYMEKSAFSWGRPLALTDKNGRTRYTVNGDAYAPGKRLDILDLAGKKAVSVRQRLPSLFPRYEIEVYGKPVAVLIKDLRTNPPSLRIETPDWTLSGSVSVCDYELLRGEAALAASRPVPDSPGVLALTCPDPPETLAALGVLVTVNCILSLSFTR